MSVRANMRTEVQNLQDEVVPWLVHGQPLSQDAPAYEHATVKAMQVAAQQIEDWFERNLIDNFPQSSFEWT